MRPSIRDHERSHEVARGVPAALTFRHSVASIETPRTPSRLVDLRSRHRTAGATGLTVGQYAASR
jgi:hypothetical protein